MAVVFNANQTSPSGVTAPTHGVGMSSNKAHSTSSPSLSTQTGIAAPKSSRRKQRCWIFHVAGITRDVKESDLLASVRERYTTVKRLVVTPAKAGAGIPSRAPDGQCNSLPSNDVFVEVQFTGPQPSEGPGALLCDLLCGVSVDARPVELPRGRKKRARTDAAACSEASDSDAEDAAKKSLGSSPLGNVEEQNEEDSAGGSSVSSKPVAAGPGSSPVYGGKNSPADERRSLVPNNNGGVAVSPAEELGTMPQVILFSGSHSPKAGAPAPAAASVASGPSQQQTATTAQAAAIDARAAETNGRMMQQLRMHQETQQQRHAQHVAFQTAQQQPQQGGSRVPSAGTAGHQWDDVVRRMTSPPRTANGTRSNVSSTHSLDVSSVDLSSPRSSGIKHEFEPLLLASQQGSGGNWGSSDGGSGLLSPMPPPQSGGPLRGGWSFDTTPIGDGEFSSGNMMDLADVDNLFHGGEGDGVSGTTPTRSPSGISGTSADAGAGARPESGSARWMSEGMPMDKVVVEPSRKEVDFEGRPANSAQAALPGRQSGSLSARAAASLASVANQCHLVFSGLDRTGVDLRSLTVTALFGVDSVHKVGKVAGPIQVGANGRTFASVYYPSMREIWHELYSTANIRVVEVDVVVEIRSESGEFQYVGPHLKVTYRRQQQVVGEDSDRRDAAPISRRSVRPSGMGNGLGTVVDDGPNVSYSCVDYSCGDWFAEMCQSVFRGGNNSHQPLHDDSSHDIMNVDP